MNDSSTAADRANALSAVAKRMIHALPDSAFPANLLAEHPKLIEHLAVFWGEPGLFEQQVEALMTDQRGDRSGFSFSVLNELTALSAEHSREYPGRGGAFEQELDRYARRI